jgi:cysteine desulfurase
VGVQPGEVVWTSGATESINLALKGLFLPRGTGRPSGRLVTSVVEHRATLDPAKRLGRQGIDVVWLAVDARGQIDLADLEAALTSETRLVSLLLANNEIGTILPYSEISDLCRQARVPLHWDACQAAGHVACDLPGWGGDMVSLSAHKVYGPQGIGALIVRKREPALRLTPLIEGGGHEQHLRSGTVPVALAVGFGVAAEIARSEREAETQRLATLRDQLWTAIRAGLAAGPDATGGVLRNGDEQRSLPGNLNISVEGVDGDRLLAAVVDVAVSSGAACSSTNPEPSHVLRAIGRSESLAKASLRFGLGRFTTASEIEFAAKSVIRVIQRLRTR